MAHPTSLPTSAAQLRQLCAVYAKPHFGRALWQLINTVPLFITLWALMAYGVTHDWNYGWVLLLALPTAGLYVRMFIVQHDCGHGSFFKSERANTIVGGVLGLITLFPYGYWRKTHNIHHGSSGNLDRRGVGAVGHRLPEHLLRGQQQLGDHVPVDAAQPLEGEESAGTPGERPVIEGCLEHLEQRRAITLDQFK